MHDQRNRIMANLETKGIITRQGTHTAALLGYYANKYQITKEQLPYAFLAEMLSITLPLYMDITEEESNEVAMQLKSEFKNL